MRVATVSQTNCPRCDAPVEGDFRYCPECAFRLRSAPPELEETPPGGGRSGGFLLTLGAMVLLAAGYLVGVRILGPDATHTYQPPPPSNALVVTDIQDHLVLIPEGTAEYVREVIYGPPFDDAVQRLWDQFAEEEKPPPPRTLGPGEAPPSRSPPLTFEQLLARPRALARWNERVAEHYARAGHAVEPQEVLLPVVTQPFFMMTHEVSRGQYAEFLRAIQADPVILADKAWVRDLLWRPPASDRFGQDYARHYRDTWWQRVVEHHRRRGERELERPDWFDQTGLSDEQGALLLVPPQWVRVDPYGSFSWELEPGTEDLPATEISWWDAHMFVVWARQRLGISTLTMPNGGQWLRAFHGGHAPKPPDDFDDEGDPGWRWPWGNTIDPNGCNCLNFPLNQTRPVLRHVLRRYYWHEGKSAEGVLNLAGNAAEWVDNWRPQLPQSAEGHYRPQTWEYHDPERRRMIRFARAAGGSYLLGIEDCGLPLKTTLDKCAREVDVGFRLIMDPGPLR